RDPSRTAGRRERSRSRSRRRCRGAVRAPSRSAHSTPTCPGGSGRLSAAPPTRHALGADAFRSDASDLMPPPIGNELFYEAMLTYATEGPGSLDAILTELDAAWPDNTS